MPTSTAPTSQSDEHEIDFSTMQAAAKRLGVDIPGSAASADAAPDAGAQPPDEGAETEPPAREDGETDEDYAARLTEEGFDPEEIIETSETEEERAARLQQQENETDEDYEARLDAEGLTRDDVPTTEPTEEKKKLAAQKARDEADLKKLPEGARKAAHAIIEKRIGKITAKAKAREAELDTRVAELESQLAEAREAAEGKPARATIVGTVHALLLDPSETAIADYIANVETFEDWVAAHEDGYEPSAEDAAKGAKAISKAELRSRLRALQRERDKLVPQARDLLAKRATAEADARKIIPAFFDAKKPEYQAARTLLREQPELKRFPDHMVRAAEIVLGRKALAELRQAANQPKRPAAPPRAPRAPGGNHPAKGGFEQRKPAARTDASSALKKFTKAPTRETLESVAGDFIENE